uniref:Neur_chan_LBD domain-containing protein n=1 Tax=Thelazia callipaeda TaxID=103827 RepID=A0A0N5CV19_THECL
LLFFQFIQSFLNISELSTILQHFACISVNNLSCNRYADQLYEDLLYFYNKNVRPVRNASSAVQVKFGASLIRIIDVVSLLEA